MNTLQVSKTVRTSVAFLAFATILGSVSAQDTQQSETTPWAQGPTLAQLTNQAQIQVPEGTRFLGRTGTVDLLQKLGNPTSGREVGTISSTDETQGWLLFFEFDPIGYVEADNARDFDPDQLITTIREGNAIANRERSEQGWTRLVIDGWESTPLYNESTRNLEWAIRAQSGDQTVLNHNMRLLGREGVMHVRLVVDPSDYPSVLPIAQNLLSGFSFLNGKAHSNYESGDPVAEHTLDELVTGGGDPIKSPIGATERLVAIVLVSLCVIYKKFLVRS